jgi:SNF2 family DNA or RNA helicase
VRKLKKVFDGIAFDEIHLTKSGSTDVTLAVNALHTSTITGLTGTLMPNDPSDAYWPLFRIFGNDTHRFPFARTQRQPYKGLMEFNKEYTATVSIENNSEDGSYKKKIPYLKNPVGFWEFMAPKMIRRTGEDPLVIASFKKAGLVMPDAEAKTIIVKPDPKQIALMLATMQEFDVEFQKYKQGLANKGLNAEKTFLINTSYVISRMTRMRMGATCPDYINVKLAEQNLPPIYMGAKGGGKMDHVYNIVAAKRNKGEKVLILSDFKVMQRLMAEELKMFNPILFDTSWNKEKRQEAFDQFNQDPTNTVFIAGPRAVGLGVDLAGGPDSLCRTVISTDLLWRPGEQQQAWARIQKPAKEKYTVEIYILVLDATIDQHVYNTFYSKMFAAEQALDRKVVTKKASAFDVTKFVDQVLADRDKMLAFLEEAGEEEMSYIPYIEMFQMEERTV